MADFIACECDFSIRITYSSFKNGFTVPGAIFEKKNNFDSGLKVLMVVNPV